MFCTNYGKELTDDMVFCPVCGRSQINRPGYNPGNNSVNNLGYNPGNGPVYYPVNNAAEEVDNRYVWALATIPIFISWVIPMFVANSILITIVTWILNMIFLTLDVNALKKSGRDAGQWLWLGIVLIPLYLFMRASKTDRKYAYAITWCVMFAIDLLI